MSGQRGARAGTFAAGQGWSAAALVRRGCRRPARTGLLRGGRGSGTVRSGRAGVSGMMLVAASVAVVLTACGSARVGFGSAAPSAAASASRAPAVTASRAGTAGSVVAAPVRIARTRLGAVAYREVGSGPPLVMIMGYGGTMADWDPRFVDTLSRRFRVVIFDNAGIGDTQPLAAPLTIDKMASQTGALIAALRLGRPDVLGYSMGGMIAQALAVLHPAQVQRLVLCATFPGTGTVIPPQARINALTSGNMTLVRAALYPANQVFAFDAAAAGSSAYPAAAPVSAAVIAAQGQAALAWFHGTDRAGRLTGQISVPTLVADGTDDQLDAVANDRAIADRIRGAKLLLYPDAGHGFLFQEGTPFAVEVGSFLAGPAAPDGTDQLRQVFTADESRVVAAGRTLESRLRAVDHATATTPEVAVIDLPYVAALDRLDYDLLTAGATGSMLADITRFVQADEKLATDVAALGEQSRSAVPRWETRTTADAVAAARADDALSAALGLPAPSRSGI